MILGFAHITKNVPGVIRPGNGVSSPAIIPNPPEKWPLMRLHAKEQYISPPGSSVPPVETIIYDTPVVDHHLNRLDVASDRIILTARKPPLEMGFFIQGLGLDNGVTWVGIVRTHNPLRQWNVKILVVGDAIAPIDQPLDVAGYAALAFYSSDVEGDRDRALAAGGRAPTEPFTVTLGRKMKIIMLRSPEGTIIELIQVLR